MINKSFPNCTPVSADDWADACGRSSSIDGFELTGKSILIAVRKPSDIPECGEFAKSLAQCCNDLWNFSVGHPRVIGKGELIEVCTQVNDRIVASAVESKMLNEGREGRRKMSDAPPDGSPMFSPQTAWDKFREHSARLSEVADSLVPGNTGLLPMEAAHRAGGFAYTFGFDMATVCPYGALNGMTGRLVAEAIRLRLRLPFWGCRFTKSSWWSEMARHRERGEYFSEFSIIPVAELYGNRI